MLIFFLVHYFMLLFQPSCQGSGASYYERYQYSYDLSLISSANLITLQQSCLLGLRTVLN